MADASDTQISPISQVLQSLGLTREDLHRHSDQMREFLTAEDANSLRVLAQDTGLTSTHLSASKSLTARAASRSTDASTSLQTPPPSATPIKSEPDESGLPPRHFDSMEMVIARKSRMQRKDRRGRKERSNTLPATQHSPSPERVSTASYPGFSLDAFMKSRDVRRVSVAEPLDSDAGITVQMPPPVTPQRGQYYRDHSTNETSTSRRRKHTFSPRPQSPTPTRSRIKKHATVIPVTPVRPRGRVSPFPASSPPPPSSPSPFSSPTKPIVNIVSSPGPMGPLPLEDDYDELPYTLPPGPYSSKKPDLSYAALVGQAILSSPTHRLTLQEIYDWITIVYPHFQRGETTWMNSIRHVLSTTACFRKVVRERAAGRTLWAIWDEDLLCFEGGGFKKQLCKDMGGGRGKSGSGRKRNGSDSIDADGEPRKAKRARKDKSKAGLSTQVPIPYALPYMLQAAQHSLPLFPSTRPTPHHQPYYASCVPALQVMPSEIIFPPLPPGLSYGYHGDGAVFYGGEYASSASVAESSAATTSASSSQTPSTSAPPEETPSSSAPGLTPNRTSSPSSPLLASDASTSSNISGDVCKIQAAVRVESLSDFGDESVLRLDDDGVFDIGDSLEPGILLLDKLAGGREKDPKVKGKWAVENKKALVLPPMPTSPSLNRRSTLRAARSGKMTPAQLPPPMALPPRSPSLRPSTPCPNRRTTPASEPRTPPPRTHTLDTTINEATTPPRISNTNTSHHTSSLRTPLSHRGLHMSPSPSLAHYKLHLDPPPAVSFAAAGASDSTDGRESEPDHNVPPPSRKHTAATVFPPVTPKRLVFPTSAQASSPFRTPLGRPSTSAVSVSPFRTPGSRGISDPHDPGALLDEELSRLGAVGQVGYDSPAGLFGKGGGGLLYESPNVPSPGKWTKWW